MDEVERALAPSFLRLRIRDVSIPAMPEGNMPPPDTVIGAFVRNVETQIAELEKIKPGSRTAPAAAAGETAPVDLPDRRPPTGTPVQDPAEELTDLREVLRLGRHLLEGRQVTL
jgi:hypothetical protein